jgi:hypothetical protein
MLEIKRLFFIYNDTRQKIIKSQVNKLAFFSDWGGGGMHMAGMHVQPEPLTSGIPEP